MAKQSAGILIFRHADTSVEFCLGHPGGPFYAKKDNANWTIFKGEFEIDEDKLAAAKREFTEETGLDISGPFHQLVPVILKSAKTIHAWAVEMDITITEIKSNTFPLEWPPSSGQVKNFPEIDKAAWFTPSEALKKIHPAQAPLITEILQQLKINP